MTDFYSVLKSSIIQRGLRSPSDRQNVYGQAREAMIRRLWSLEPPLSEDEISTRIGLFDAAVEKIEEDLGRAFAASEKAARQRARPQPQAAQANGRARPGYDEAPPERPRHDRPEYVARAPSGQAPRRPGRDTAEPPTATRMRESGGANGRSRRLRSSEPRRAARPAPEERTAARTHQAVDDEWPVAEEYVAASRPRLRGPETGYRQTPRQRHARESELVEEVAYVDDVAEDPGDLEGSYGVPAVVEEPIAEEPAYESDYPDEPAPPYDGDRYADGVYQEDAYQQPPYEEAAYYEYDAYEDEAAYEPAPAPSPRRRAARTARAAANDPYPPAEDDYDARPARRGAGSRPAKRARPKRAKPASRTGGRSLPILAIALGALALILVAFNVYVFLPILLGSDETPTATTATPTKVEDRLPALDTPGTTRIVSNSATAVEIPERNLDIAESLVVFDGTDPTVFEGTSNNPIHFNSDSEGGFARISSAASAAGARAIIGPGLADRLAGRTVRVTLLARSSNENGAAQMRFAYQSGLAVSHWQSADLSANYGAYGMIWRVPAADPGARDYLLIEPGIPGDGTSTDIRMIRIDILTS